MPPKKSISLEIRLTLKRGKQVLIILVPSTATVLDLKLEIQEMVNATGGLKPIDDIDEPKYDNDDEEEGYDDGIDIPIPSIDQASDDDGDYQAVSSTNFRQNNIKKDDDEEISPMSRYLQIDSPSSLKIGRPVDKLHPVGTNFSELQAFAGEKSVDTLSLHGDLSLGDGDVLAFATMDEDFLVVEPVEAEDE
ncbi:hypothetical protein DASC09_021370 [Saccharomycopsis crataegensis]|uniref:Uncharacterized protein n=1 Tax=Saccharomycopsis crataegensis TaxID=43959 RepID=A0AAV5QJ41_9ASCO|nr:hypothetical protein DASC09_021370 [Saccharomycopsis crataegensis]